MKINKIITILALCSISICNAIYGQSKLEKPNILIIQMDDMGFDDLSINGNTASKTVNIDKLAQESVQFDNFYVASVCAPTRASLLTGRDFWRTSVTGMHGGNDFLNIEETTFADLLQKNGYITGMWGKWHSGKAEGYWPWQRGFDEGFYAKLYHHFPSNGYFNGERVHYDEKWSDEQIADMAIDFMERNKTKPFLAYVSSLSTHGHWKAPQKIVEKYLKKGWSEKYATLLAMQEFADLQIGRILKYLEASGLEDKTVVFFMSDNGPIKHGETEEEWLVRNNHTFIGNKARNWKNGIKSPMYVRYKGVYEPKHVQKMCSITDIFPTLLELTGTKLPKKNLPIDGRSMVKSFTGNEEEMESKEAIFSYWTPTRSEKNQFAPYIDGEKTTYQFKDQMLTLITDDYKLIYNAVKCENSPSPIDNMVLIDHKNDVLERTNIASANREIADQMRDRLEEWFNEMIEEEHSFKREPAFVGYPGSNETKTKVLAVQLSSAEGFENRSHLVDFPKDGNGEVGYKLKINKAGKYTISAKLAKKTAKGFDLKFKFNGQERIVHFAEKSKEGECTLRLEKGDQLLKITMTENSTYFKDLKLSELLFERKKTI
ncbi:sulfatase-like hydrolase/transferase [Flammeovirga sp. OC4]|uniref:sulfatase-like hydrolase/transferase n=1 Tax=Flammeovirga sp. OC4 TaxID=1382345 RepID=UPI000694B675|nr:sulfatase-like hydrolase/transferase [Flammeovirga sp. OC4]